MKFLNISTSILLTLYFVLFAAGILKAEGEIPMHEDEQFRSDMFEVVQTVELGTTGAGVILLGIGETAAAAAFFSPPGIIAVGAVAWYMNITESISYANALSELEGTVASVNTPSNWATIARGKAKSAMDSYFLAREDLTKKWNGAMRGLDAIRKIQKIIDEVELSYDPLVERWRAGNFSQRALMVPEINNLDIQNIEKLTEIRTIINDVRLSAFENISDTPPPQSPEATAIFAAVDAFSEFAVKQQYSICSNPARPMAKEVRSQLFKIGKKLEYALNDFVSGMTLSIMQAQNKILATNYAGLICPSALFRPEGIYFEEVITLDSRDLGNIIVPTIVATENQKARFKNLQIWSNYSTEIAAFTNSKMNNEIERFNIPEKPLAEGISPYFNILKSDFQKFKEILSTLCTLARNPNCEELVNKAVGVGYSVWMKDYKSALGDVDGAYSIEGLGVGALQLMFEGASINVSKRAIWYQETCRNRINSYMDTSGDPYGGSTAPNQ